MYGEQRSITEKLKPIGRRSRTLDEHIYNAEKYPISRTLPAIQTTESTKAGSVHETHCMELTHYKAAVRYLNDVMNGKTDILQRHGKKSRND